MAMWSLSQCEQWLTAVAGTDNGYRLAVPAIMTYLATKLESGGVQQGGSSGGGASASASSASSSSSSSAATSSASSSSSSSSSAPRIHAMTVTERLARKGKSAGASLAQSSIFGTTTVAGRLKKMQKSLSQSLSHSQSQSQSQSHSQGSQQAATTAAAGAGATASATAIRDATSVTAAGGVSGGDASTAGHWLVRVKWHLMAIEGGKEEAKEGGKEDAVEVVPASGLGLDTAPGQGLIDEEMPAPGQGLVPGSGLVPAPGLGPARLKAAQHFHEQVRRRLQAETVQREAVADYEKELRRRQVTPLLLLTVLCTHMCSS